MKTNLFNFLIYTVENNSSLSAPSAILKILKHILIFIIKENKNKNKNKITMCKSSVLFTTRFRWQKTKYKTFSSKVNNVAYQQCYLKTYSRSYSKKIQQILSLTRFCSWAIEEHKHQQIHFSMQHLNWVVLITPKNLFVRKNKVLNLKLGVLVCFAEHVEKSFKTTWCVGCTFG